VNETTPTHPQNSFEQGGRILVLEPEEDLASKILAALREATPSAQVNLARSLEEAQRLVMSDRPDLFVLDVDAVPDLDQDFLYDLRTSHPNARAIVLTGVHFAAHRERVAGLGAIHFLEKPFPHADFVDLVHALLSPSGEPDSEKFQGTLSDLHLADIIQLKCMSGSSAVLQFTGPQGEKARVYFENGQVRHATAPGKEGVAAFNEIVNWKGGQISEVSGTAQSVRTIDLDWQILLMEAVRKIDEARETGSAPTQTTSGGQKVLVIDDSLMLLSFVKEILAEANYQVATAATAEEGLVSAKRDLPDLVLLDYVLPDMKGDEVSRHLSQNSATAKVPIIYMSGFGADLKPDQVNNANVIGSLNKPFTSDLLLRTVEKYMPKGLSEPKSRVVEIEQLSPATEPVSLEPEPYAVAEPAWQGPQPTAVPPTRPEPEPTVEEKPAWSEASEAAQSEAAGIAASAGATGDAWWSAPSQQPAWPEAQPSTSTSAFEFPSVSQPTEARTEESLLPVNGVFFSGDTSFFSLNGALQAIGKNKLTGTLRAFWNQETVELVARNGQIILVTTRDPQLYCPEAPITLVNVDAEQIEQARAQQRESGCPIFLALAQEELILHEPAVQLVQHYGQKLFAQLWTAKKVRFVFEQSDILPEYCREVPGEADIDHWVLTTLRCIQFQELVETPETEADRIPAYTRNGYERVQDLRLTIAEAQFASQFNGVRSIAQIAKNLRLDFKFARLTLFRFLALEIVECWPPTSAVKQEKRSFLQRLGKSIGFGD
jgi:twitching motility two-component system response regulator PilH